MKAHPAPGNLLEWHYALEGPAESDFEGGIYHGEPRSRGQAWPMWVCTDAAGGRAGKITFPKQYPFKPPVSKLRAQAAADGALCSRAAARRASAC